MDLALFDVPVAPARPLTDAEILAKVRAIHAAWGSAEVDDINPQRLWEQLDDVLGGVL